MEKGEKVEKVPGTQTFYSVVNCVQLKCFWVGKLHDHSYDYHHCGRWTEKLRVARLELAEKMSQYVPGPKFTLSSFCCFSQQVSDCLTATILPNQWITGGGSQCMGTVLATFAHRASVPWSSYQIPGLSLIPRDMLALLKSCLCFIPVPWGMLGANSCLYQGSPEK